VIPYGKQEISQQDIDAVIDVLKSDFLTQGPQVPAFEKAIALYCENEYAVAMNSATSALHLACRALNVGVGDTVWTSPISFVASANCALYCGASVDFVDIDPKSYNLCPKLLAIKLEHAETIGTLPKVVIPVHLSGQSCDMESIYKLSQRYGFAIIEDASHAIGGRYKNSPVGSCRYSDISIFSFHPVKIITTAEGGVAVTRSKALSEKMSLLRNHGITREESQMKGESDGPWYYQQQELGYNYRMTELQAALGLSQLSKLDECVRLRRQVADRYKQKLAALPITLPEQAEESFSAWHLYIIRLNLDSLAVTHRQLFEMLRGNGIGVNLHYIPIYRQPFYASMGFQKESFPHSEQYYREAISIPLFHQITSSEQDYIVETLTKSLAQR
jgi:UDP-4-amino-4,6-dideoxy-N-acetyl-beta-L-altrosamine transaminase